MIALGASRLRYQGKRRGYHGGISPAELVVPCALFRAANTQLEGEWVDLPPYEPEWWSLRPVPASPVAVVPAPTPTQPSVNRRRQTPTNQPELFTSGATSPAPADWIDLLLASEMYADQARQAVRGAPQVEQLRGFLKLLEQRQGTILKSHCAQQMEIPMLRVDGLIQNYRRLLNVDGYDVLSYDPASETIALNIQLLMTQFGL